MCMDGTRWSGEIGIRQKTKRRTEMEWRNSKRSRKDSDICCLNSGSSNSSKFLERIKFHNKKQRSGGGSGRGGVEAE